LGLKGFVDVDVDVDDDVSYKTLKDSSFAQKLHLIC